MGDEGSSRSTSISYRHLFDSQVLHFQSSSLLMLLGKQQIEITQVPQKPARKSGFQTIPALAIVSIWEHNVSPSLSL